MTLRTSTKLPPLSPPTQLRSAIGLALVLQLVVTVVSAAEADKQVTPPVRSVVTLHDGQTLRGVVTHTGSKRVSVRLQSGAEVTVPLRSVASIRVDTKTTINAEGQLQFMDPNRTRYFYSPSAYTLKSGECYFSQKELFFSAVACGLSDNVSVLVGGVVPAWGFGGFNLIVAMKAGVELTPDVHIATGFETLIIPGLREVGAVGFLFGNVTVGERDAHLSIAVGAPIALSSNTTAVGPAIMTVSGNVRVARGAALVTENWVVMVNDNLLMASALGVRLMGEHHAVDLGLVFLLGRNGVWGPLPWLDYTYNF